MFVSTAMLRQRRKENIVIAIRGKKLGLKEKSLGVEGHEKLTQAAS
jgi:hypothetical protein